MKQSSRKINWLLLAIVFVCSPFSTVWAKPEQTPDANYQQEEQQRQDLVNHYVEYYKHKTPDDIWKDYLSTYPSLTLNYDSDDFREPFKSWAVEELFKKDFSAGSLGWFLLHSNHSEDSKTKALYNFVGKSRPSIDLFDLFHYLYGRSGIDEKYYVILISKILEDLNISNPRLVELLWHASPEQKDEIASRVLNNNPNEIDLAGIINAKIDFYSDTAQLMLIQMPGYIADHGPTDYIKREALLKVMSFKSK